MRTICCLPSQVWEQSFYLANLGLAKNLFQNRAGVVATLALATALVEERYFNKCLHISANNFLEPLLAINSEKLTFTRLHWSSINNLNGNVVFCCTPHCLNFQYLDRDDLEVGNMIKIKTFNSFLLSRCRKLRNTRFRIWTIHIM